MSIEDITPEIRFVHPTYFPPDSCCHNGKCCAGIMFYPAAGEGDEADIRAMVFVNDDPVEEFDPQKFIYFGITGTCQIPEDIGIASIRVQLREQSTGKTSFLSPNYLYAPKPIRMLA